MPFQHLYEVYIYLEVVSYIKWKIVPLNMGTPEVEVIDAWHYSLIRWPCPTAMRFASVGADSCASVDVTCAGATGLILPRTTTACTANPCADECCVAGEPCGYPPHTQPPPSYAFFRIE